MPWCIVPALNHGSVQAMRKNTNPDRPGGDGADRRRMSDRRGVPNRRTVDLERRLAEMEDLARANRRELGLQFTRIAQIQADLDALLKSGRANSLQPPSRREHSENQPATDRAADRTFAAIPSMPSMDGSRRS